MRRPNLFLAGSHRCGTTAMFEFLGAHPEIYPSPVKEPHFFTPERNRRSLEEYLELFAGATAERWLLDGTPEYVNVPDAARRIRELSPDARAIVMLRDPVEQLRSLHDHRTLFQERPVDLATDLSSPEAPSVYWARVRSGENLARLLKVFPREDVHVVVYDDFKADNAGEYRETLEFLEVDPAFVPRFRTVMPTSVPRSEALQRMLWGKGGAARTAARVLVPRRVRRVAFDRVAKLNRRPDPRPEIDPALAAELWRTLEPDVERLSRLLDRDLVALWRR